MSRFAVLLAAVALTGCPVSNPLPTDAGTSDFVGRSCNVDAECGTLRCDKIRRQCICLSDDSCKSSDPAAAPRYCNNYTGLCVTEIVGCTSDAACGQTEWCDPSTRACRPLKSFCEPCSADSECGGQADNCVLDSTLNQRFCGKACTGDGDCPRGATCQDKPGGKQCWPDHTASGAPATCDNFQGCVPDSLRTCNTTMDCGDASQRCDVATGKCVAVQQVCPFGTTCDPRAKICVADCLVDADCGAAGLKCIDRVCEPLNECTDSAQCPDTKVCAIPPGATTGACVPFCTADTDCALGQTCQKVGAKYACAPGCAINAGCPVDQRCNLTTHLCEGPMVGSVRTCQATQACRSCEFCDALANQCGSAKLQPDGGPGFPYCQVCASPQDCGGNAACVLLDTSTYCMRLCGTGQECPQGFVCLGLSSGGSACVPADRTCTGKCP